MTQPYFTTTIAQASFVEYITRMLHFKAFSAAVATVTISAAKPGHCRLIISEHASMPLRRFISPAMTILSIDDFVIAHLLFNMTSMFHFILATELLFEPAAKAADISFRTAIITSRSRPARAYRTTPATVQPLNSSITLEDKTMSILQG
jgi:hypothetical protein